MKMEFGRHTLFDSSLCEQSNNTNFKRRSQTFHFEITEIVFRYRVTSSY